MKQKKKKKHLRLRGVIFLFLLIYLVGSFIYYLFTFPVKNIVVKNNHLLTEGQVVAAIGIDNKMPMYKFSRAHIKKKLSKLPLVDDIKIQRTLTGKVTITIEEAKPLFFYNHENKLVLSNGKLIDETDEYLGYPTLVNYVPTDIYEEFIKKFAKIDEDIIGMISEIEYSVDKYNDSIIDDKRFLMTMNDGNKIYINNVNMSKLNKYQSILDTIGTGGTLYLDSSSKNYIYKYAGEE